MDVLSGLPRPLIDGVLLVVFLLLIAALIRSGYSSRSRIRQLDQEIEQIKAEMASMCRAGTVVDRKLEAQESRLHQLADAVTRLAGNQGGNSAYHGAIQNIQQGAEPEELVDSHQLSRDEAELLVRLHGRNRR